ncbi:MAG: hypothetical protein J5I94_10040 [Phaeodactylibacter sp.]|nr:hypothetical protein [Phaeodactylibacter sp.]
MSQEANKWEADVRQAVETHEFGYDPEAWAAMEGLLDGAGGGVAGASPGAGMPGLAWGWKVLILLLLGAGGLLLWWYWPAEQAPPQPPTRTERPALPDISRQPIEPSIPEEGRLKPGPDTRLLPDSRLSPEHGASFPLPALPEKETPFLPLPLREEQLRRPWAVPPALPTRAPAELEIPGPLPPDLQQLLPEPVKQRRDRKTLFPDVIEKY